MLNGLEKQQWVSKVALAAMFASLVVFGAGFVAVVVVAAQMPVVPVEQIVVAGLAVVAWGLWCVVGYGAVVLLSGIAGDQQALVARVDRVESVLESLNENTRTLIDLSSLSDRAKGMLYRERELDAFREAIHSDLMKQDFRSAEALIESIEAGGYLDQAARLRQEVENARNSTRQEKIDNAVQRVEDILTRFDWDRAQREAGRLAQAYPESDTVRQLPQKIEAARNQRKRELLQQYGEAVRKNAVDEGIKLLKKLDSYLSPQEAAALRDSARGVFRAKLHNLGVQFAICVTDQRWAEAVATGEEIMRDFPNSRMAHEVREKIDTLRNRAAGA
jgi:hypothetical protein